MILSLFIIFNILSFLYFFKLGVFLHIDIHKSNVLWILYLSNTFINKALKAFLANSV